MQQTAAESAAVDAEDLKVIPVRHWGRWVAAVVLLVLLGLLIYGMAQAQIDYGSIPGFLHSEVILQGLWRTLVISVAAQALGILLGIVFAIMRLSKNPVVASIAWLYIWFFRGTPVIVQLLIWFNLSLYVHSVSIPIPFTDMYLFHESMNDFMTPFMAALLGLGLNEGAYMAEIVRAGIISVEDGQSEAALSVGMTRMQTMRRVILPQAMRVIVPPTGNEFINMLKTSSLAYVATYNELFRSAQSISSVQLNPIETLFTISIWYLVLTSVATIAQYYIERRFARGSRRDLPETPIQRLRRNLFSWRRPRIPNTSTHTAAALPEAAR